MTLTPAGFPAFFDALWGCPPFPWQARLADRIAASGWPRALDLPTASGKTAAIDIALFHLALEAGKEAERTSPARIVLVVDRRLVVDGAFDRAVCIAEQLATSKSGIRKEVADALRTLAGTEEPLRVVRLRGGAPMEPDWIRSPAQPAVVVSTVDQVGSRLLFRGYGVSESMRPLHAGLLGSDALFLLDEAHLSQPFVETLAWVERYRADGWVQERPGSFTVVHLSATLPQGPVVEGEHEKPFALDDQDRAHPVLARRLDAHKPTELHTAKSGLDALDRLAGEFVERATHLAKRDPSAKVIAIVVNRVGLARAIFEHLCRQNRGADGEAVPAHARPLGPAADGDPVDPASDEGPPGDAVLLIGRSRSLDRDRLLERVLPRMRAGRAQDDGARRLYVVATQCIEAGADLDFDALVTHSAPLDCLRQRFGRLDRLGERQKSGQKSQAIILTAAGEVGKKALDPIYGDAVAKTWEWLQGQAGKDKVVDFGIDHLGLPIPSSLDALLAPRASAPVMLPAYVDAWTQTSPAPGADPEVSLFLHGPHSGPADVQIVWRADLEENDLHTNLAHDVVSACPPSSLEAVSVPFAAARRWLAAAEASEVADVEGAADASRALSRSDERPRVGRPALRWRGANDPQTKRTWPDDLRPGDFIVVPASYGGCDGYGWKPEPSLEVSDLAFEAALRHRHRLTLRLHPRLLRQALDDADDAAAGRLWQRMAEILEAHHDDKASLVDQLAALDAMPRRWQRALDKLAAGGRAVTLELRDAQTPRRGAVLSPRRRLGKAEVADILGARPLDLEAGYAPATEHDASSFERGPVELVKHCTDVEKSATDFARPAGLPAGRVHDIALAARLHDLGKAEARFQIWLRGGDELAWLADETPLAKSSAKASPAELHAALRRARLPSGARHECWSVRLAERHPDLAHASDPDLVLWLIGTHHGRGRPFFPPVVDERAGGDVVIDLPDGVRLQAPVDHRLTQLDSGWVERFERLKCRYGVWELARMEAILRLADHRTSELEAWS